MSRCQLDLLHDLINHIKRQWCFMDGFISVSANDRKQWCAIHQHFDFLSYRNSEHGWPKSSAMVLLRDHIRLPTEAIYFFHQSQTHDLNLDPKSAMSCIIHIYHKKCHEIALCKMFSWIPTEGQNVRVSVRGLDHWIYQFNYRISDYHSLCYAFLYLIPLWFNDILVFKIYCLINFVYISYHGLETLSLSCRMAAMPCLVTFHIATGT